MEEMIPIFGMVTGVLTTAAIAWALVRIMQGQIGTAVARWIQSHGGDASGGPELVAELSQLHERVDALQQQLEEAQERLDFAERLLASGRSGASLPGVRE